MIPGDALLFLDWLRSDGSESLAENGRRDYRSESLTDNGRRDYTTLPPAHSRTLQSDYAILGGKRSFEFLTKIADPDSVGYFINTILQADPIPDKYL